MSRLNDLMARYGDTRELPLTEAQQRQIRDWAEIGAQAMEYPELASDAEYQRYLADPEKWLRDHAQR